MCESNILCSFVFTLQYGHTGKKMVYGIEQNLDGYPISVNYLISWVGHSEDICIEDWLFETGLNVRKITDENGGSTTSMNRKVKCFGEIKIIEQEIKV